MSYFISNIKSVFKIIGTPVLVWIFPAFFLYSQNVKEMQIVEIVKPCLLFLACDIVLLLIGRILFKTWEKASVYSLINGAFLVNFSLILGVLQKTFPVIRYWHLLSAMLIISYLISKSLSQTISNGILKICAIAFGGLIIFNFITATPTIITKLRVSITSRNNTDLKEYELADGKRNIYYLLCDEYASFAQLEKDFNYDNSDFKSKLKNLGFNISENSYNDSPATAVVMANIMSLDYVATDNDTASELSEITKNGLVQKILVSNGYKLRGIGETDWLGIEGTIDSNKEAVTVDGSNATQMIIGQSVFGALMKKSYIESVETIVNTFDALKKFKIEPNSSTFTIFYVCAPHHPYYLKADGSMNSPEKWTNYDGTNNDSYIGEIEYINKHLYTALKRIIENDPNSIIILCSDHGNRFGSVSNGMPNRILNTIYYHGDKLDSFDGLSGINTLRYVFNREFDVRLPYIDLP